MKVNSRFYPFFLALTFLFSSISWSFAQEIRGVSQLSSPEKKQISYLLDYPEKAKGKVPLIVFLHGSGERGTNLDLVKAHSPFTYKELIEEPVAILAPQCPENVWWDTEAVYALIKEIQQKYSIDPERIHLTGLSMGGWGSWKLANEHPELFASLSVVCAPADRWMRATIDRYKTLPIRIFHGGNDDIVSPMNAITMYQELRKIKADVALQIFPDDNHNSWDSTYSNKELYTWMLSKRKPKNNNK